MVSTKDSFSSPKPPGSPSPVGGIEVKPGMLGIPGAFRFLEVGDDASSCGGGNSSSCCGLKVICGNSGCCCEGSGCGAVVDAGCFAPRLEEDGELGR